MLNGTGLRVVLWVSGCEHSCKECHNPITWDVNSGLVFDKTAKDELFEAADKDYIDGITLSGGDPLHPANRADIEALVREFKEKFPNKTIWIYTGYMWGDIKDLDFISLIDVSVDGKFEASLKDVHSKWCGSANQRVIDVKESLKINKVVLID